MSLYAILIVADRQSRCVFLSLAAKRKTENKLFCDLMTFSFVRRRKPLFFRKKMRPYYSIEYVFM